MASQSSYFDVCLSNGSTLAVIGTNLLPAKEQHARGETHLDYFRHPEVLQAAFIILALKYF